MRVQQIKSKSFAAVRDDVGALHHTLVDTSYKPPTMPSFAALLDSRDQAQLLALQDRAYVQRWCPVETVCNDNVAIVPTKDEIATASHRSRLAAGRPDPKSPEVLWATPFHVRWRSTVVTLPVCSFGTAFTRPVAGATFYLLSEKHGYGAELLECILLEDKLGELVLPFSQINARELFVQQHATAERAGTSGVPVYLLKLVFDRGHPQRFSVCSPQRIFALTPKRSTRARRGQGIHST